MRSFLLCLLLLMCAAPRADAFSRAYRPIGDYVRQSPLVVVVDITTQGAAPFATVLTVREVLKQDDIALVSVGDQIELPLGITRYVVPREAQNALVVMAPNWKNQASDKGLLVSEVYQTPEQITAARALVKVYEKPDERARLLALQTLAGQNKFLDEQLLADLSRMRNRDNFDIALESYARLETENRGELIRSLGTIGDMRALPLLIAATRAPEPKIWRVAIDQLTYHFPDAPGVNEALRMLLDNPEKRPFVLDYLSRRDPNVPTRLSQIEPTHWMRAQTLRKNGDLAAARAEFFAIIDEDAQSKYGFSTLMAARDLIPLVQTETDKTRVRHALLARLQISSDYMSVPEIIELLRQLPAPENVAALLAKLTPPDANPAAFAAYMWHKPAHETTFALLELGADARKRGAAQVMASLQNNAAISDEAATIAVCELAWLADDTTWKSAAQISPKVAHWCEQLQPLRAAAQSKNEAQSLAALLPDTDNRWQNRSDLWIIARLGELRDGVAVAPLLAELKRAPYAGRDEEFRRALVQIGGESAQRGALELLDFPETSQRALGMDVLRELPDFDVRPLLLKILAGADVPDKTHAIFLLGYIGTPQDLAVLQKLADFWTTDLAYQRRAVDAIIGIRERYPQGE